MFLIMILLLQLFTFGLGRSLQWLFAPVVGKAGRRWLMGVSYFVTNGLLAGLLLDKTVDALMKLDLAAGVDVKIELQ